MQRIILSLIIFTVMFPVGGYAETVIGSRTGNILVERYFNDLPEGKRGPWVVEILKDTNPQEFLVRGANLVPDRAGLLGGETGWGGLSEPSAFSSSALTSFNRCNKPDGAVFYIDKGYSCSGTPETVAAPVVSQVQSAPALPNDEIIGMRGENDLVARYFNDLPDGKKGPWVVEVIENSNPQEFLVRGANLVPDRAGLLGGDTGWGGLSQSTQFPASLLQSYNSCTKPDGAIFYLPKTNACPGVQVIAPDAPIMSPVVTNPVSVPSDGGVRITEPNRPPYYYSDNKHPSYYDNTANLPVIIKNELTYSDDDVVFLENDKIKIGINLRRGGHIAYAGLVGKDFNYVNNGYDGGRQIGLDAYQKPEMYTQNGKTSELPDKSYNVTLGGDLKNNAVTLIDYRRIGDSYYVKLRPNFYLLDSEISETYIESTYTLMGNAVKVDYRYTSYRTDNQLKISGQFDFVGWAIPAMFVSERLTRYATYTGDQPFQRGPLDEGQIPSSGVCAMPASQDTKEFWGAVYNPSTGLGIGVANREPGAKSLHIPFKQCEVYPGNPSGSTYDMGFTYFGPTMTLIVPDGSNFVREDTAYVILGTVQEIREGAYRVLGH